MPLLVPVFRDVFNVNTHASKSFDFHVSSINDQFIT